ncbi:kinesin-related protein 4-like [Mesocricetus auratus]|uniref:Kinesin-related protein 4-like n=1 Tax=Mesocricetus auratus TaxID=10036 RepID=A0A1U7Q707_MESAU|nr:kinesin-related protein 4-like [Mesocricetus auratus]
MDTMEKPSYGSTASAPAAATTDNDDDGDAAATAAAAAAAATANDGDDDDDDNDDDDDVMVLDMDSSCKGIVGRLITTNFLIQQKKHVEDVQSDADTKEYYGAVEHLDAMYGHQLSKSVSEDDVLLDYDNILMIVDQLQMKYKASGRLLETQDANHSYKMILEHNQSHSESLTEKSKKMKNPVSEVLQKPQETEKAKSQLSWKNEEQQLELLGVGLAGEQEAQQRNALYFYEKIKKQLTEKEDQHQKEKQQLEMCLMLQDVELRHLRNDMKKLQETRDQEAQAEESDRMVKEHLQKVEQEIFKLEETVKKQAETIEQLEKKLLRKDNSLIQIGQEFVNNFREMYTTSVMRQLEFRIQSLQSTISEIKIQTRADVLTLDSCNKLHQSYKLRETQAQLKDVISQLYMVTQNNMSLLNILAAQCPRVANFHKCLGNHFTQENMMTPTSSPPSSKHYRTANVDVVSVINTFPSESKKFFKRTKTKTEHKNEEHSFSEVSNPRQFEMESPLDIPRYEITAEDQETVDNTLGNHDASFISPQESRFTNLQSEHSKEMTHQGSHKAKSKRCKDPYLERLLLPSKSKERQDKAMRKNSEKMEPYSCAPNICMTNPASGFAAEPPDSGWEHNRSFLEREPLIHSPLLRSSSSGVRVTGGFLLLLISIGIRKGRKSAKLEEYEEFYLEMVEMTKSLSHEQLKSKKRQDEAMRKNFEKTELYSSALNTYITNSAQEFAAGHPHSSQEHGESFIQEEPLVPGSRPWHFVESLDNYVCRRRISGLVRKPARKEQLLLLIKQKGQHTKERRAKLRRGTYPNASAVTMIGTLRLLNRHVPPDPLFLL